MSSGRETFALRPATAADKKFLFALHRAALRESIEATWGWDEQWQRDYFERKFDPAKRQIIQVDGRPAGVLGLEKQEDALYLALIELLPEFQGGGVGTAVITNCLQQARVLGLPLTLHVLQTNPAARRLYERLGFDIIESDEIRIKMQHPAD